MLQRNSYKIKDNTYYCKTHNQQFKLDNEFYNAGYGCPMCATDNVLSKSKNNNECYLYLIEITNELGVFYKVGIASRGVSKRYSIADRKYFTDITEWHYKTKREALIAEAKTVSRNRDILYRGDRVMVCVGITEIFSEKPIVML